MKNLITSLLIIVFTVSLSACSSTRPTKEVDHTAKENKAMRHRDQATDLNNAGHQKDQIRAKTK